MANFDIIDIESLRLTKASLLMHQNLAETPQLKVLHAKLQYENCIQIEHHQQTSYMLHVSESHHYLFSRNGCLSRIASL